MVSKEDESWAAARASAEDIFNESAVDGQVSFEAFQKVMAAAVEGG